MQKKLILKILLRISYDGTNYHGWQVQNNGVSIQEKMCEAASIIYQSDVKITGCSRTDSGVHAKEYYCTLETMDDAPNIPVDRIPTAMNMQLPEDITVYDAKIVENDFHARYFVKSKTYEYVIDNGYYRNPFLLNHAWHYKRKLDEKIMDLAAKEYIGTYDFSAFMAAGSSVKDTVRTIYDAEVIRDEDKIIFRVNGNGFLFNMVRIMMGTLVNVSEGKIKPSDIKNIILSCDRKNAGLTAPSNGLYLLKVKYE